MNGEKVILDGRYFYEGHRDAWRSGVVVTEPENHGPGIHFVTVECPPPGRERKSRRLQAVAEHLLRDTAEVRAKLAQHGINPAELTKYFPGCGFNPIEETHESAEAARAAGEAWLATVR